MIKFKLIINVLSRLIVLVGVFMLLSLVPSFYYHSGDHIAFIISSIISIASGSLLYFLTRNNDHSPGKKEGYFIATLGWIVISLFGSLPFILSGAIPSFTNAFFETMSGFTTTGASILTEIESLPKGILFWRSIIQWIGGMGIIVLTVAIIPFLGIGGMQLFVAEVPGPTPDKLHPRITQTAKRLWIIYVIFTLAETILLKIAGMSIFDAVNHSFTTMATGGYSTKNASIAAFNSPYIHYIITVFMFIAGTNFTLSYFAFNGNLKKLIKDDEFKNYFLLVLSAGLIIAAILYLGGGLNPEKSIRDSIFQVVSIVTTTGFVTANYEHWGLFATIFIFILMFVGGSAGSTGGGMKIIRLLLLIRNTKMEFKRLIHPRAVVSVRFNAKVVPNEVILNILSFFFLYILIFVFSSLVMIILGLDFYTAIGSVAASLGNIGPGIGDVGAVGNYAEIPIFGKWFLSFLMLLGRLELFTVLILFTKIFWKK
ncbi:MAG: TrkH family potassium uptake protein [Bacteroidota bacterium]|nr:TrkH family potassium uptake protein [Bacteroidota bacterium]